MTGKRSDMPRTSQEAGASAVGGYQMNLYHGKGGWFWGRENGAGVQAPMKAGAPAKRGGVHTVFGSIDSVSVDLNVRTFKSEAKAREWKAKDEEGLSE